MAGEAMVLNRKKYMESQLESSTETYMHACYGASSARDVSASSSLYLHLLQFQFQLVY
jgi:hypothetical protein